MGLAIIPDSASLIISDPLVASDKRAEKSRSQPRKSRTLEPRILDALAEHPRVLFLDIETTGLSRYYDEITLAGWMINGEYDVFIAGDDPRRLFDVMRSSAALVTFNGKLFDVPFLMKAFPTLEIPSIHADLRFLARRASLTGGQKAIERELGLNIRLGYEEVDGAHAVLLWHQYLRGDSGALRTLIEYNRRDILGMRWILDEVVERLVVTHDLLSPRIRFAQRKSISRGWASHESELPSPKRLRRPHRSFQSVFSETAAECATIVGVDLTGSEARPSGWCELRGSIAQTTMVSSDKEIVERIIAVAPHVVSLDSPLSIPNGRTRVEDDDPERDRYGIMRKCERELKRRGINVYPCLLPSMQGLTRRGMRLSARLRKLGYAVIESYPGAAQDIMGIPRKGAGEEFLKRGLIEFGIRGNFETHAVRHDELDAITSALVGSFFLAGKYEALSGPSEEALIIPDLKAPLGPLAVGLSGPIAAGKTTAAKMLEKRGFAYTRFSAVVDDEIRSRGETPSRENRQRIGLEINSGKGQRWLCERVLERADGQQKIVVDGLRFLEDRAFFVEQFGARFIHIHVSAPIDVRARRYKRLRSDVPFEIAEHQPVEREVGELGRLANRVVENHSTKGMLASAVVEAVAEFVERGDAECRYPSS